VQLLARARAAGVDVHAFGLTDHYRHIFEITRLADFVALHTDEASAVA
jgi:anti-anti-sigma regulatory factor